MLSKRHASLHEWVAFNGLEAEGIRAILSAFTTSQASGLYQETRPAATLDVTADQAWAISAEALAGHLPALETTIVTVRDSAPRRFNDPDDANAQAYTLDRGADALPFVNCRYDGTASALLVVAHEFAHAVQIVASRGTLMPPVAREVCAFLGEHILLRWAAMNRPDLQRDLERAWRDDNAAYLGTDVATLSRALEAPESEYDYRWNYPVARVLARKMFAEQSSGEIETLFSSGAGGPDRLPRIAGPDDMRSALNTMPTFPAHLNDPAGVYRQLGVIVAFDVQDDDDAGRMSIADRFAALRGHMQTGSAFIGLGPSGAPLGYVLWDTATTPWMARLHAPFGRQDLLLKGLRARQPEIADFLEQGAATAGNGVAA